MKNLLVFLTVTGLLVTGCGMLPQPAAATPLPAATSTIPVPTPTLTFTPTAVASITAAPELQPISDEASAYLEEALDIIQRNSLHRHTIDWELLRKSTFDVAQHAQTPADTYGAIRYALVRLGDHHSHFNTPVRVAEVVQSTASDSPAPRSKLLLDKLGFIALEGFASPSPEEESKYATTVQELIRDLDEQEPCGWIVDLRENNGGNMWAMLAGLGPILGEGEVGAFVDPDGYQTIWSYRDGQAMSGEYVSAEVNGQAYELKEASPPVAVLTGTVTASAGEAVAVAFRGRPNTRSFGLYTGGQSTANTVFPLSDGAWIVLTVAVYADRTGQTYGDRIYPDELVDEVQNYTFIMDEALPQPAIDWLLRQPACTHP